MILILSLSTSQLWNNAHHPDLVEPTCRQSLLNLGLDYIDLYLIHWPVAFREGPESVPRGPDGKVLFSDVDIMATYRAMEDLVRKGLVRSIGVSNFNSAQLQRVVAECAIKPVVNQVSGGGRRQRRARAAGSPSFVRGARAACQRGGSGH